jgi:hypothetical protein
MPGSPAPFSATALRKTMTLSITTATLKYVCQISDRRLRCIRPDGTTELYTDHANKATLLWCKDAKVTITYYGIGADHTNETRTDTWLVKTLQKSNPTKNLIERVLEELGEQASDWMGNLRSKSRAPAEVFRHTFLAAGWVDARIPVIFYISNYENLKTKEEALQPWSEFASSSSRPEPNAANPCSIHTGGAYKSLKDEDFKLLSRVVKNAGAKPEDVINIIVRSIRNAADSCSLIGKSCMSTLLLPGEPGVQCHYHSASGTQASYMPNIVGPVSMWDVEIYRGDGTPPWQIRDIREAMPAQLTKRQVVKGMRKIPAGYKTGDGLPADLDPVIKRFLESLPPGITEHEILDAL